MSHPTIESTASATKKRGDVFGERVLLISADDHAGPPLPAFAPFFDTEFREDFDRYWKARPHAEMVGAAADGDLDALAGSLVAFMRATGAAEEVAKSFADRAHRLTAGLFDSAVRDACLDEEGIAGEVIYPDGFVENHPPFSEVRNSEVRSVSARVGEADAYWPFPLRLAGARAYNRWLAQFCAESPTRRAGAILLPPAVDVPSLVEEMMRAREAGLRGGVLIPPLAPGLPGYHDPLYDPIWAAAVDLGLPIAIHGGAARAPDADSVYGLDEPLHSIFHFTECAFFDRRPLWQFMWGRVFDRHPKLRLIFAEALAHWVPGELLRLDEMYDMWNLKMLRDQMAMSPGEYWTRNCAITATFPSRAEVMMRGEIGEANMLWGSDYPHPEGTWPYTETCLRHAFHGVEASETGPLLAGNALNLYGFDLAAMRRLAERIGPEPESLLEPPGELPADYCGMGLR